MKPKKLLSFLLATAMTISLLPAFSLPAWAASDDIIIANLDDLKEFRRRVNEGEDNFAGKTVELVADIDLEGSETNQWTPIGNNIKPFLGKFNGGGHKITGLYINNTSNNYQGLFGYIGDGAEIKNLGVVGKVSGNSCVGGIASVSYGIITNCYNTGTVSGNSFVGGIVGWNDGTVTNCYNTGKVSGYNSVGGIAGFSDRTITNCYNTGKVSGDSDVGGIMGYNGGGTVTNCYNTGKVSGGDYVGGIVGANGGSITNCYYLAETADGGINGSDAPGQAEAITAEQLKTENYFPSNWDFTSTWIMDTEFAERPLLINNMEGDGSSEATAYKIYTVDDLKKLSAKTNDGNSFSGKYFELMNDIDLKGSETNQWTPIGNIGKMFLGKFNGGWHKITGLYINNKLSYQGLFGCIGDGAEIKNLGVSGTVIGKNIVGGIVGYTYNKGGTVTNCYNTGTVSGENNVGGIVGYSYNGTITNCYNTGKVSGYRYVGGIVGYSYNGTITNCYYLERTADGGINGSDDATNNVVGKEEEEFKNGIVAYLLQGTQNEQIWGQRLKGNNTDQYPVLSSDAEDKVYKISFMKKDGNDYVLHTEAGANADGMKTLPGFDSDVYDFKKWVQSADINATEFNEDTAVTADMTVYAVGEEITAATAGKNYVIEMTYGEDVGEINLSDYVENKSGAADNFTFTLVKGTIPQGLNFADGKINGTPTKVGTEEVEFTVTNNSGIMLMSLGLESNTLTLKFEVGKAITTFTKAPTKKTNLIYDSKEQELVTAGETSDGTVKYSLSENGTYSADIPTGMNAGTYTVWYYIEGDSNHLDSNKASIEVTIAKADSQTTTTADATVTYGETLTLTATVTKSARELNNVEFYVGESDDAESLGTASVTYTDEVNGTATLEIDTKNKQLKIGDNIITAEYGGSVNLNGSESGTITVTLEKKTVGLTWNDWENLKYDGNPKNVTATATGIESGDGEIGVTVTGGNETNAGNHTATATELTGTYANYYKLPDNATQDYTIKPKAVMATISDIADQTYTGKAIEPQITAYDDTTVIPASEYTVAYSNNENAGTATVTLTDNPGGNYTVSGSKSFTILPKPVTATIANIADQTYTGRAIEPQITVYDGLNEIPSGEYKVEYEDNQNAGTATVTLLDNADGNYIVSGSKTFKIKKADSSVTTAPTKAENLVYTGEELTLLTADGTAEGGTIKYSIDGENFTYNFADIPKVTDAKDDHKVWYKVVGDANHNDTTPVCIEIKVAKKPVNTVITLTAPVKYATPETSIDTDEYTATVVWSPTLNSNGTFATNTEYTAIITITLGSNYTTVGIAENGYTLDGATSVTNVADSNVITAVFPKTAGSSGGGGSLTSRYTVKFDTDGGNAITNQTVTKNSKATEPTEPTKEGYIFDGWYTDSEFTTEYDFDTKVTKNITLYAKWVVEDEVQEPSDDKKDDEQKPTTDEWKNPFTDVTKADWFFNNVKYVNENGLMSGVTSTEFAPNLTLTRGMLVTILYRLAGEPAVNKSIPFADVTADSYYANAVIWAEQNGIVSGVNENEFAPDENITREQIAVILYRYAKFMGYDVSVGEDTNILSYTDFDEISKYAIEAMQYAVGSGLIKGKTETTLNPKDNATRAEIAAILQRFIEGNK